MKPEKYKERWHRNIANSICPKCTRQPPERGKKLCRECLDKCNLAAKDHQKRLRKEVISAYGAFCKCCGETNFEFLVLDHVNNDGASHRKSLGGRNKSGAVLSWAKKNSFPDSLQVLCANCNMAKQYSGGCPHKKVKRGG